MQCTYYTKQNSEVGYKLDVFWSMFKLWICISANGIFGDVKIVKVLNPINNVLTPCRIQLPTVVLKQWVHSAIRLGNDRFPCHLIDTGKIQHP